MSAFEEKFEVEHHIAGPARRQLKTLIGARGYKKLTKDRVELTSPFGDVSLWEFETTSRAIDAWLRCVS